MLNRSGSSQTITLVMFLIFSPLKAFMMHKHTRSFFFFTSHKDSKFTATVVFPLECEELLHLLIRPQLSCRLPRASLSFVFFFFYLHTLVCFGPTTKLSSISLLYTSTWLHSATIHLHLIPLLLVVGVCL